MMGLPETIEGRLMRAMIEAAKQHRLRREREEIEKGDWADVAPESVALRPTWGTAHPPAAALRTAASMVNTGGDGSDFALFVAAILESLGAHVRLAIGCANNVTLPATVDAARWSPVGSRGRRHLHVRGSQWES